MARCLVTGNRGYIGSRLFKELKRLGHDVIGIDLQSGKDVIEELHEFKDGSFLDKYQDFQPEFVFHMACWPRVGYSLEKPIKTMKNNVLAGSVVLNFARKWKSVKRVIYSSSSSVVGNGRGPTNPYALQKLTTEMETQIYSEVYDLDTVSLRYFNVYSEDQNASGPYATAIAHWIHSVKNDIEPYITGDGEQRRDMVHVEDVVSANIFAMNCQEKFNGKVFDVGTGDNISLNEIKDIVLQHHDVRFNYTEARPGEVMITKAKTQPLAQCGWTANISIKDGITRCFNNE